MMDNPPYCRLLATGLDVSGLQAFSDARGATRGFRFPSGRNHEINIGYRDAPLLFDLVARSVAPHIGAVSIGVINLFRIGPGEEVAPHRDLNHIALDDTYPIRLQLVIAAAPGCQFFIGDETIDHRQGDLWEIRGTTTVCHHARNGSDRDRTIACLNIARRQIDVEDN